MTKFLTFIVVILGAASVHAADTATGSEFMHQTPVGKFELTPKLEYKMRDIDYGSRVTSKSAETKGFRESLNVEYGLADDFSAGLLLATQSLKTTYSPASSTDKQSGLEDPVVFFHGKYALGGNLLRYGVDVNFSMGKSVIEASGDMNNASGGMGATPFIGFETNAGSMTFGGRLGYKMWLGDRKEEDKSSTPSDESENSGAEVTTLTGFGEFKLSPEMLVGAALEIEATAKEEDIDTKTKAVTKYAGRTTAGLKAYGAFQVGGLVTVIPEIEYVDFIAKDNTTVDKASDWNLGVAGRFAF